MRLIIPLFLLLAIFACPGFAQTTADQASPSNCASGLGTCNSSLLTNSQKEQIAVLKHEHNLLDCLNGSAFPWAQWKKIGS